MSEAKPTSRGTSAQRDTGRWTKALFLLYQMTLFRRLFVLVRSQPGVARAGGGTERFPVVRELSLVT